MLNKTKLLTGYACIITIALLAVLYRNYNTLLKPSSGRIIIGQDHQFTIDEAKNLLSEINTHQELFEWAINSLMAQKADLGPLLWSAYKQRDVVKRLVQAGANINTQEGNILHRAALDGDIDMVTYLLDHGADVNATESGQPLIFSAIMGGAAITKLLLKHKMPINGTGPYGIPALHMAAWVSTKDVVELLTHAGADIHGLDTQGRTALYYTTYAHLGGGPAVPTDNVDIAAFLIARGAKVTLRDTQGETPLHAAALWNAPHVTALLLKHHAEVNAQDIRGFTPLCMAAIGGSMQTFQLLMNAGADITHKINNDATILHLASNSEIARIALENGMKINAKDNVGRTALHYAAGCDESKHIISPLFGGRSQYSVFKNTDIIQFLIDSGADINARDNSNKTPLDCAYGWGGAIEFLEKRGAKRG